MIKFDINFYRQLSQKTGGILIVLNLEGEIIFLNDSGYRILGYKNGDLHGHNWFETCIPDNERVQVEKIFKNIVGGKIRSFEEVEGKIVDGNGNIKTILWANNLLTDKNDKTIGTISTGHDITELIKREQEISRRSLTWII